LTLLLDRNITININYLGNNRCEIKTLPSDFINPKIDAGINTFYHQCGKIAASSGFCNDPFRKKTTNLAQKQSHV